VTAAKERKLHIGTTTWVDANPGDHEMPTKNSTRRHGKSAGKKVASAMIGQEGH